MSKIKKVRKIKPKIKEIPKEISELEEEINENEEKTFVKFLKGNTNSDSTLEQTENSSENLTRIRHPAKNEEDEINFRPTYTTGENPYETQKYESNNQENSRGESAFETKTISRTNDFQNEPIRRNTNSQNTEDRNYIGTTNKPKRKSKLDKF